MKFATAVFLTLLASLISACASAPDQGTDGAALPILTTQSFDLGELSYIFEIPAETVDVAMTLDTAGTVEALIPVEGGTITATGADGTVYSLEIPADALLNETLIGLTPVTSVADMPFGGEQTYAVQLSPEGLFLFNYAILTITPAQEIPLGEQIFFGYLEDGKDLILAAPVVDSSEIKILVQHFSGNGVTKGLLADIEPVRQRLGGSAERRLESAISAEMTRLRSEGATVETMVAAYAALEKAFNQYEEQVVKPRVDAAGESCAAGNLAIQTVVKLYLLRTEAFPSAANPFDKYPGLMDKFVRVCVKEEYELCVEQHIIYRMEEVWQEFKGLAALFRVSDATLQEARDLTIKCLTFKLEFESTSSYILGDGWSDETTVTSEIILRYRPDINGIFMGAPALLVNVSNKLSTCITVISTVTAPDTGFFVNELRILPPAFDDPYGKVDFVLNWLTGKSDGTGTADCGPIEGIKTFPITWWFLLLHQDERDATTGVYATTDWEFLGGELFAQKEWTKDDGTGMSEFGSFNLYHTPGE